MEVASNVHGSGRRRTEWHGAVGTGREERRPNLFRWHRPPVSARGPAVLFPRTLNAGDPWRGYAL